MVTGCTKVLKQTANEFGPSTLIQAKRWAQTLKTNYQGLKDFHLFLKDSLSVLELALTQSCPVHTFTLTAWEATALGRANPEDGESPPQSRSVCCLCTLSLRQKEDHLSPHPRRGASCHRTGHLVSQRLLLRGFTLRSAEGK